MAIWEAMMGRMAGVSERQLARMRGRLVEFASEMFEAMPRRDQRRWGEVYLRGLMLDGKRKSIEPMAARLADGDEQCLQQFVNQSPWSAEAVRRRLALRMSAEIAPAAWVIDDTGFPKFGRMSVAVGRQYCGALGKVANCQVGVSISAVTPQASCPIDWRLYLPPEWDEDPRRAACRVPDAVRHQPKWRLALAMIDELVGWGITPPPVLGDGAYGRHHRAEAGSGGARGRLRPRRQGSHLGPPRERDTDPAGSNAGPRPAADGALSGPVLVAGRAGGRRRARGVYPVCWREGTGGPMSSRFVAVRVRPANIALRRAAAGGELAVRWLLAEWPEGAEAPSRFWLSNLPPDTPILALVELAKLRWRIEQDYRELKDALGLDHFEGRSFGGWHHHVTLVSVAHGFLTTERLHRPPTRAAA